MVLGRVCRGPALVLIQHEHRATIRKALSVSCSSATLAVLVERLRLLWTLLVTEMGEVSGDDSGRSGRSGRSMAR